MSKSWTDVSEVDRASRSPTERCKQVTKEYNDCETTATSVQKGRSWCPKSISHQTNALFPLQGLRCHAENPFKPQRPRRSEVKPSIKCHEETCQEEMFLLNCIVSQYTYMMLMHLELRDFWRSLKLLDDFCCSVGQIEALIFSQQPGQLRCLSCS